MAEETKNYDNTNSGALFKNPYKTEEKHPHYTGKTNIEGKEYEVAAWVKTSKAGKQYMSLSYQLVTNDNKPAEAAPDDDDDLPF